MLTDSEATNSLFQAITTAGEALGEDQRNALLSAFLVSWKPEGYFYQPDERLVSRLKDYREWYLNKTGENVGQLMEEIALLAFRCLKGFDSVVSYQSYAAQLDLVISGSSSTWYSLLRYLHLDQQRRTFIVEAKNLEDKVDDKQFSRLCAILDNMFSETASLGIFLCRKGATGFPGTGKAANRMRSLSDAQATQIIFHARTNKFVIVLNHDDILQLDQPGALPRLLESKIRGVETWTGLPLKETPPGFCIVDLPAHLKKYMG